MICDAFFLLTTVFSYVSFTLESFSLLCSCVFVEHFYYLQGFHPHFLCSYLEALYGCWVHFSVNEEVCYNFSDQKLHVILGRVGERFRQLSWFLVQEHFLMLVQ